MKKEQIECSICKKLIQRKCLDKRQKTSRCQKKELVLNMSEEDKKTAQGETT